MFERGSDATTRKLSGASFSLTVARRKKTSAIAIAGSFFLVSIIGACWYIFRGADQSPDVLLRNEVSALTIEVRELKKENIDLKMKLEHEQATRQSLEREFSAQTEALKLATKNLAFYRKNSGSPAAQGAQ